MKPILFFTILSLLLSSVVSQAYAIDIASYTIVKEELKPEKGELAKWQNHLQFLGSTTKIKLARTLRRDTEKYVMGYTDGGFDEKSLKVEWLNKDDLLWITWSTHSQREAGYDYDGHVVLKLINGTPVEIFRHNYCSYWYQGGCTNYKKRLELAYSQAEKEIELRMLNHEEECATGPILLGIKTTKSEPDAIYSKKLDETFIWKYQFSNNALLFKKGQMFVDLGTNKFNLLDIASYYGTDVESVVSLNRQLGKGTAVTGKILIIDSYKNMKVDLYDGLYGLHRR